MMIGTLKNKICVKNSGELTYDHWQQFVVFEMISIFVKGSE
jgi:hypothetical protein